MTRIYWPGDQPDGDPDAPTLGDDQVSAIMSIREELLGSGRTGAVLIGAEVGSGKTVTVIEGVLATVDGLRASGVDPRVLLVGPRDVYGQWAEALADQIANYGIAPEAMPLLRIDATKSGKDNLANLLSGEPGLYYAGLEYLRAQDWEHYVNSDGEKKARQTKTYTEMKPLDLIVSDEAHRHSNRATAALKTMRSIPAHRKIALSGTFFGNKFENAHTVTRWLWPEVRDEVTGGWLINPHSKMWQARWCRIETVRSKAGRPVKSPRTRATLTRVVAELHPGEFVKTLPCYIYLPNPIGDAPPSSIVRVPMTEAQEVQYEQMEAASLAWLKTELGVDVPLVADLPIVQRTRLRTVALGEMSLRVIPSPSDESDEVFQVTFDARSRSGKLNALHELLHGRLEGHADWAGEKALILTHSAQFAHEVARRMGAKYPGLVVTKTGADSSKAWDESKRRFRLPKGHPDAARWLVATIGAVGTGTDGLQQNCSRVAWLSLADSAVENVQGTARIWRRGVRVDSYSSVEIQSIRRGGELLIDQEVREVTAQKESNMARSIRGKLDN